MKFIDEYVRKDQPPLPFAWPPLFLRVEQTAGLAYLFDCGSHLQLRPRNTVTFSDKYT